MKLDDLPLFATDRQIAEAIVGRDKAEKWMSERLPTLAKRPGFPPIDAFHGGRPVPLVKRFYQSYLGISERPANDAVLADGREGEWKPSKRLG
jgi:hypothetical protein